MNDGIQTTPGESAILRAIQTRIDDLRDDIKGDLADIKSDARQAEISSVSYSHDDGQATVQLDNERDRLQRLVASLAAIQAGGA